MNTRVSEQYITALREEVRLAKGGAIRSRILNWRKLTSDPEVLESVTGLPIELVDQIPAKGSYQHFLKAEELTFLRDEIQRLLHKGVIEISSHEEGEYISPVFLRPKSDGDGYRMILNLKKLNQVSEYHHFKMDTLKSILVLVTPGIYMTKLDIKDAYYSVPIKEEDRKLLKFRVDGILYQFMVLPNGYTAGPRKFTKLLKPALSTLRRRGKTLAAYLDDLFLKGKTFSICQENLMEVIELLQSLGFTIHADKTVFNPSQEIEFLGFVINSITMTVCLTLEKKLMIKDFCDQMLMIVDLPRAVSIRDIAKLLGKFSSSFLGVPEGKLHYRKLERDKTIALAVNRGKFDKPISLSQEAIQEIIWWRDNVTLSRSPIYRGNPTIELTTDASKTGWGAVVNGFRTGGFFDEGERDLHINILESKAVFFGLNTFSKFFENTYVKVLSDNMATVGAINNMGSSRSEALDEIIQDIWRWILQRNSWLIASHIPGVLNTEADEESRLTETKTEWMLNSNLFNQAVTELRFNPSTDLFASRLNKQLPLFVSYRPDPEASSVDAFSLNWEGISFYAFPPFICVGRAIQKITLDNARGILVVPDWPNQTWYQDYLNIVIREIVFSPRADMLELPMDTKKVHPLWRNLSLRVGLVSATGL